MLYVTRNKEQVITAIFNESQFAEQETLPRDHPEIIGFLQLENADQFIESDLKMSRVLEDLIDLLISKHVIMLTELPSDAQAKLLSRQKIRDNLENSYLT